MYPALQFIIGMIAGAVLLLLVANICDVDDDQ